MKSKFLAFLLGFCAATLAFAQDKSLLDFLVKSGKISEEDASQIAKNSVVVTPGTPDTKKLSVYGGASVWYTLSSNQIKNPANMDSYNENGFVLRHIKLGVNAEIQGEWSIDLVTDFGIEGEKRNYLDKVTLSKKIDFDIFFGTLDVGLRKVNMGMEQGTDDFKLLTPERSIATWFFTRPDATAVSTYKNFGSRAIGVFWDGTLSDFGGLYYGMSVVGGNSYESENASLPNYMGNNNVSFYANAGYKGAFEFSILGGESQMKYDFGLNFGYANGGFRRASNMDESNGIFGINPYLQLSEGGLTFMMEYFLQNVQNGRADMSGRDSNPMGANIILAYKFAFGDFGEIEPVIRASYVYSDGMGLNPMTDILNNVNLPTYDRGQTYFIGANWYMVPSVKITLGYEWGQFTRGNFVGSNAVRADSNTLRAQFQVLF